MKDNIIKKPNFIFLCLNLQTLLLLISEAFSLQYYNEPFIQRKCSHNHEHFDNTKYYTQDLSHRSLKNHYWEEKYHPLRIYFDYNYTLPQEESILKEIVIPPVKEFFESTLKVKRSPGKLKFPYFMSTCQQMDIPQDLIEVGVDADIIIMVSTYKGMKKKFYEKYLSSKDKHLKEKNKIINQQKEENSISNSINKRFRNINNKKLFSQNSFKSNNSSTNEPWNNDDDIPIGIIGWASLCLQDSYTLRPVAGAIQFVDKLRLDIRNVEEAIWTAIHELTHVFAFDYYLLTDFVNEDFTRKKIKDLIAVRSSLNGLEELINERKVVMDDIYDFINFNQSYSFNSSSSINNQKFENNQKNEIQQNLIKPSEFNKENIDSTNSKIKNKLKLKHRINFNSKIHNFENSTSENESYVNISTNSGNNTNKTYNISINPLTFQIVLDIGEDFKEIKIPENFNLYTLSSAIENFAETTKIYIKSPRVLQESIKHFNCSNCLGMELEHFGGPGSAYSHWSKRILNTDYMIADIYGEYFISNITLALFEDSGWYKVNYKMGQHILWGKNEGCDFIYSKCITSFIPGAQDSVIYNHNNDTQDLDQAGKNYILNLKKNRIKEQSNKVYENTFPLKRLYKRKLYDNNPILFTSKFKEFCKTEKNGQVCSISHKFRAQCIVVKYPFSLPLNYQYYHKTNVGGISDFGDYCPYPYEWITNNNNDILYSGSCQSGRISNKKFHESVCVNCRCFISNMMEKENLSLSIINDSYVERYEENFPKAAVCYRVECKIDLSQLNKLPIKLVVIIGNYQLECPYQGGIMSSNLFYGSIECPKTEEICIGELNPYDSYENTSSYYLFETVRDRIIGYFNKILK